MKCNSNCLCSCSEYCLRPDNPKLAAVLQPRCVTKQFVSVLQVTHFSRTRTILSSPPCDPFFLIRQFRHGSCRRDCLASGEQHLTRTGWKAIAAKQLVHASNRRKASRSNVFLSTVSVGAISAAASGTKPHCIAKQQRLQHERPRRRRQPGHSRTSPI